MASMALAVVATPGDHIWTSLKIYPFGPGNTPQLPIKRNGDHLDHLDPLEQLEQAFHEVKRSRFFDDSHHAKSIIAALENAGKANPLMQVELHASQMPDSRTSWVCDLTVFGAHYRTGEPFATKLEAERAVADPAACWALYTRTLGGYSGTTSPNKQLILAKNDSLWAKAKLLHPRCRTEESLIRAVIASHPKFKVLDSQDTQTALTLSTTNSSVSPQHKLPAPYVLNDEELSYIGILVSGIPSFTLNSTGHSAALGYTLAVHIASKLDKIYEDTARDFLENFSIGMHRALLERPVCGYWAPINHGPSDEFDDRLLTQEVRDVEVFACATIGRIQVPTHESVKTFAENLGYEIMTKMECIPWGRISTYQFAQIFYTKLMEQVKPVIKLHVTHEQF